ncbi:hypothetical protein SEVIR_3G095600v4 [Setaria viridis]|uniref:Jacalin-type lectin domain-containing protein n=1 Tax=Setaria viridis TaxID=4556 RepID=A0A4U6VD60_SETVI|nr:mannose/glucose-specific lectin-like [Setaria viridis]TKW25129.1 hypothetical protein SEVIR_3G095600v2 [Setaria viridis]
MSGEDGETTTVMVGPWGEREVNSPLQFTPKRLVAMAFQTGRVIVTLGFTYVDVAGKRHTIGLVGGDRGKNTAIKFAPTEYVTEFAGSTIVDTDGTSAVKYLRIQTNLKTYEINEKGSSASDTEHPFRVPLPENSTIVGFFGRQHIVKGHVYSIGIYVNSTTQVVPLGAWGGDGGEAFDVSAPPLRLESMTIRAGNTVDAFGFSYVDEAGRRHIRGPSGGTGGQLTTIRLAPTEFVNSISGTIGRSFGSQSRSLVASLQIGTNVRTYGPYGRRNPGDDPFSIPLPENFCVVGFWGRAGNLLDAIGVYIGQRKSVIPRPIPIAYDEETSGNKDEESYPLQPTITGQTPPIKIGMWGGGFAAGFDVPVGAPPKRLDSVMIRVGEIIDAFGFSYTDQSGEKFTRGPYGGSGGSLTTIQLEPSEYVKNVSGTTGTWDGYPVVASLTIETNFRVYGPYGKAQDMHFRVPLPENACVVGFFGMYETNHLDAIGVYVSGCVPN